MKAKGIFISTLLVIDTFLVSYAAGFQSRHVLIVNAKLPPVVHKVETNKTKTTAAPPIMKPETKDAHAAAPRGKGSQKKKNTDKHASNTAENSSQAAATTKAPAAKRVKPPLKTKASPKPQTNPAAKPGPKPVPSSTDKPGA